MKFTAFFLAAIVMLAAFTAGFDPVLALVAVVLFGAGVYAVWHILFWLIDLAVGARK